MLLFLLSVTFVFKQIQLYFVLLENNTENGKCTAQVYSDVSTQTVQYTNSIFYIYNC